MHEAGWKAGDWVVYRKQKSSPSPGPRAKQVSPAPKGEVYHYLVDKYWVIEQVLPDGNLQLRTRRGKQHTVSIGDHRLRRAKWWERWFLAGRFPSSNGKATPDNSVSPNSQSPTADGQ